MSRPLKTPGIGSPKNSVTESGSSVESGRVGKPSMTSRTVAHGSSPEPALGTRACVGVGRSIVPTRDPMTIVRRRRCDTP